MQNFYGQAGVRYVRYLLLIQTLFFVVVLFVSIVWALDRVSAVPVSSWTFHLSFWLLVFVLAAWIIMLSQASPASNFASPRRTKQFVGLIAAGAIMSSVLALVQTGDGSLSGEILVFSPIALSALAVCALSSLYIVRLLKNIRNRNMRYETDQAKLSDLRTRCGAEAVARIELSHALEFGSVGGNPVPGPRGYVIAGLTSKPWHDCSEFAWTRHLEQSYEDIREELGEIVTNKALLAPYGNLVKEGWDAIRFVQRHQVNEEYCRRFPKTAEILKSAPHYPKFRDAMFSVLAPGTYIPPHRDGANVYLTCHLGLKIPSGCEIRVGGQTRGWEEGKCIVFDSSYEHEAWNTGDQPRIVLLVDFLHPELTDVEAEWVAAKEATLFAQGA